VETSLETNRDASPARPGSAERVAVVIDAASAGAAAAMLRDWLPGAGDLPTDGEDLLRRFRRGADESLALNDYAAFFAVLPSASRAAVERRWGGPERDPCYRAGEVDCGRFALQVLRFGAIALCLEAPGESAGPPPHRRLALAAWLRDQFRAGRVESLTGHSLDLPA
jgi:cobaltochelatase CobN